MTRRVQGWLVALSALALMACGGEETSGADLADAGAVVCDAGMCGAGCGTCDEVGSLLCTGGMCTNEAGCDLVGFEDPVACGNDRYCEPGVQASSQAVTTPSVGGAFKLKFTATIDDYSVLPVAGTLAADDGRPVAKKKLFIELDHTAMSAAGKPLTGTFELGGDEATEDCTFCVRAGSYCNDMGCAKDYVASAGTVEIIDAGVIPAQGEPATQLVARLRGVTFTQVEFDKVQSDGTFKEVRNGQIWCLGDFDAEVEVNAPTQPVNDCVTDGNGNLLGNNVKDYTLKNCYGEEITLHSRCGKTKAVWVVAVAGW